MEPITGDQIGSAIYFQLVEDVTPVPMMIITDDGMTFFQMEIYKGFEQIRKDQGGDVAEILFMALGFRNLEKEFFRWLKPGEKAQLESPSKYYRVLNIQEITIGR